MYVDAQFWPFLIAVILLSMSPGVDTLLVIRNTTRGGTLDGITTSLAICCGLFVHATLSAMGLSLILLKSAWAFEMLKLCGAAYLIWLGANSLMAVRRGQGLPVSAVIHTGQIVPVWLPLREGFLSNVLNPKTIIFYMAFLPQFIAPGDPALAKSLFLAAVHFAVANIWQIAIVLMVRNVSRWLASSTFFRWLNGVTGGVLVALGARLAFEQRPI